MNSNIPPLIDDGFFIPNYKKKADIINEYFANQCTINVNDSVLPNFVSKTDASLHNVSVTTEYIINIINTLCSNKAHGYDGISVAMLKLCASEVAIPLQIIFQDCINSDMFPEIVGNTPMFNLFIKKVIDRLKVIIDPSRCYLFAAKF